MKIKSFGCSFIFGSDLSDLSDSQISTCPVGVFSRLTWPAVVSKTLGFDYECFARPGSGNLQIAERVLNECVNEDPAIYVIDWTWIDRFDYIESEDFWQPWNTLRPNSKDFLSSTYFKHLQSEYKDKLASLIIIKTVVDTLLQKNIKFVMTYEDDLMFDQRWNKSSATDQLQQYLRGYMSDFDGLTFLQWSRSQGFAESSNWHPLDQAHQEAAKIMLLFFDKQKIIDPAQQAPS
jgi:hypothetical protein